MTDQPQDQPLVTSTELDLDLLAPLDRMLRATVDGERRAFPVRGKLKGRHMMQLLQLEAAINSAFEDKDADKMDTALAQANGVIHEVVREKTPDAPDLGLDDMEQIMAAIAWLAGDVTVADEIARVLTGGASGAVDAEAAQAAEEDASADGSGLPFTSPSAEPTPNTSKPSENSTEPGRPDGGETSTGESSSSTSSPLVGV